jgi:serine/threonine protein kinase
VLVDFGAVRSGVAQTGGSTMVGTFGYMAPELFRGEASEASDLYAVGALACALLTGREPHTLMDGAHVLRLPDRVAVSAVLRALLGRLLAAEVEGRPASASEALALLRRGGAPAVLVRAAPVALARREGEESLFGLSAALALVLLFLSPCLVMTIGLLPTLSVMGGVALLAILCVPFMKGDEG